MTWYYQNKIYEPTEEELKKYAGFVYVITELSTGKMYVGKKTFWSKKTRPPLKGKTRKRRSVVESDWKNYYGSSGEVLDLLLEHGGDSVKREILHLCMTKGELSYMETYEIIIRHAIISDEYYNSFVGCKIHKNHVPKETIERF